MLRADDGNNSVYDSKDPGLSRSKVVLVLVVVVGSEGPYCLKSDSNMNNRKLNYIAHQFYFEVRTAQMESGDGEHPTQSTTRMRWIQVYS